MENKNRPGNAPGIAVAVGFNDIARNNDISKKETEFDIIENKPEIKIAERPSIFARIAAAIVNFFRNLFGGNSDAKKTSELRSLLESGVSDSEALGQQNTLLREHLGRVVEMAQEFMSAKNSGQYDMFGMHKVDKNRTLESDALNFVTQNISPELRDQLITKGREVENSKGDLTGSAYDIAKESSVRALRVLAACIENSKKDLEFVGKLNALASEAETRDPGQYLSDNISKGVKQIVMGGEASLDNEQSPSLSPSSAVHVSEVTQINNDSSEVKIEQKPSFTDQFPSRAGAARAAIAAASSLGQPPRGR